MVKTKEVQDGVLKADKKADEQADEIATLIRTVQESTEVNLEDVHKLAALIEELNPATQEALQNTPVVQQINDRLAEQIAGDKDVPPGTIQKFGKAFAVKKPWKKQDLHEVFEWSDWTPERDYPIVRFNGIGFGPFFEGETYNIPSCVHEILNNRRQALRETEALKRHGMFGVSWLQVGWPGKAAAEGDRE